MQEKGESLLIFHSPSPFDDLIPLRFPPPPPPSQHCGNSAAGQACTAASKEGGEGKRMGHLSHVASPPPPVGRSRIWQIKD